MSRPFPRLFNPLTIDPMMLRNRIVMAPHAVVFAPDPDARRRLGGDP